MLQAAAEKLVAAKKREEAIISRNSLIFPYLLAIVTYR